MAHLVTSFMSAPVPRCAPAFAQTWWTAPNLLELKQPGHARNFSTVTCSKAVGYGFQSTTVIPGTRKLTRISKNPLEVLDIAQAVHEPPSQLAEHQGAPTTSASGAVGRSISEPGQKHSDRCVQHDMHRSGSGAAWEVLPFQPLASHPVLPCSAQELVSFSALSLGPWKIQDPTVHCRRGESTKYLGRVVHTGWVVIARLGEKQPLGRRPEISRSRGLEFQKAQPSKHKLLKAQS